MTKLRAALLGGATALALTACSQPVSNAANPPPQAAQTASAPAAAQSSPPAAPPAQIIDVAGGPPLAAPLLPQPPDDPRAQAINQAAWPTGDMVPKDGRHAALTRAEVLLARAHFSPGVIDGREGGNLASAVAGFQRAKSLPVDGKMSAAVFDALTAADQGPAIVAYTLTADDVKGPFLPSIPTKFEDMAKLAALSYTSPLEGVSEKFHMDEALLKALNPDADFDQAGARILVAAAGPDTLPARVARIEVDKGERQVRAYGADGALLASYPATVGSAERPAPTGSFTVKGVARDPTYTYDPRRLTFGDKSTGKLTIKPGPNNPVGAVWIDLSIPTYGIHGAPDPRLVGKTASHGCVRLTNWDVRQLSSAVKPGAKVDFVGVEGAKANSAVSSATAG